MSNSLSVTALQTRVEKHGLLAKWREDGYGRGYKRARGFKLGGHMGEVHWGLDLFFGGSQKSPMPLYSERKYESFADALYCKMGLKTYCSFDEFARLCYLATLAHDLGKSGGEFQQMLWLKEEAYSKANGGAHGIDEPEKQQAMWRALKDDLPYKQAYRHEFLSAILLFVHPEIRTWFQESAGSPEGFARVLAGALGHHLKATKKKGLREDVFDAVGYVPKPVFLHILSNVVRAQAKSATERFGVFEPFPTLTDWKPDHTSLTGDGLEAIWDSMHIDPLFSRKRDDPVSGAIKWMVILADTFGSISSQKGETNAQTRAHLEDALRGVIGPRDPAIVSASYDVRIRGKLEDTFSIEELADWKKNLHKFQKQCATIKNVICPISTGGGKTIGALLFGQKEPKQRLLVTTTTTDTTSSLFFDYALPTDSLLHSRSDLDQDRHLHLTNTPDDDPEDIKGDLEDAANTVDAFRNLGDVVTFTTADQVLGVMTFYRSSVMRLPYLLTASVVFDEIGSYDSTMMAWYLKFLEWFPGIRTAHLSATMSDALLANVVARTMREDPRWKNHPEARIVKDSKKRDSPVLLPRYRVHIIDEKDTLSYFKNHCLWIVNTVGRCQGIGRQVPDATAYHSRFLFENRWDIRDEILKVLSNPPDPLARDLRVIATQVAEISFDISGWDLLTEPCPPETFPQRAGRVNRPGNTDRIANIYVYWPTVDPRHGGLPYIAGKDWKDTYNRWMDWVQGLTGRDLSKQDLNNAFQDYYRKNPTNHELVSSSLLGTFRHNVRSGSFATQCIRREDHDRIRALNLGGTQEGRRQERLEVMKVSVPLLLGKEYRDADFFYKHAIVDRDYDPRLGILETSRSKP